MYSMGMGFFLILCQASPPMLSQSTAIWRMTSLTLFTFLPCLSVRVFLSLKCLQAPGVLTLFLWIAACPDVPERLLFLKQRFWNFLYVEFVGPWKTPLTPETSAWIGCSPGRAPRRRSLRSRSSSRTDGPPRAGRAPGAGEEAGGLRGARQPAGVARRDVRARRR